MKNFRLFLLTLFLCWLNTSFAQYRISLFFRSYPAIEDKIDTKKLLTSIAPQKAIKKVLKTHLKSFPVPGVFGTYAGYLAMSDLHDGHMIFPRKHQRPSLTLVITPNIEPVLMLGKTVHHWSFIPGQPAQIFNLERKQDPETLFYFWEAVSMPKPDDNVIPLDAVVLFSKPKNIYIPSGITLTSAGTHLILPDIYVKKGFDLVNNALQVLKIKHFFEPIKPTYKQGTPKSWLEQIQN